MTPEQNVVIWARSMLGQDFVWGVTDCAMLALFGIDCFHGTRHAEQYIGGWATEAEALAHFQTELPSTVLQSFGAREVPATKAVIGDVVTAPRDPWPECLHFVLGRHCLSADPDHGVVLLRTSTLLDHPDAKVWRLG